MCEELASNVKKVSETNLAEFLPKLVGYALCKSFCRDRERVT